MSDDILDKARLLIESVTSALRNGYIHIDPVTNKLLTTPKDVLECLRDRGRVILHGPEACPLDHDGDEPPCVYCSAPPFSDTDRSKTS